VPHTVPDCLALTTVKQTFDVPHAPTIAELAAGIEARMPAHMDERIASFEMGFKLVMASLATANAMGLDVPRTSVRDGCRMTDHTTNILPPCATHTSPPHTNILHVHDTNILPVHDTNILPPYVTHTLTPHTKVLPVHDANILPHTANSIPPRDTISGPVPLRQPVVSFDLPLTHSDPEVSVAVELKSIQPPTSGCNPVRSPPLATPMEVDRLPRMKTTNSSAPSYHGPHTLKVGSARYAPELCASSRTIRVYGPSIDAVDIRDDVPHKAIHEPLQVYHIAPFRRSRTAVRL
jgi:hypothetical protein